MLQTHVETRVRPRQRPSATAADKRFGRYRKEDPRLVRRADVSLDLPRDLRQRREMLRAMSPEQALSIIEVCKGLTFFEALELAKRTGKLIVPNDVHDRILTETTDEHEQYLSRVYPARTGTVVIYEAPDEPFEEQVNFRGITFSIPRQFQGKVNCALAVDHPDWDVVGDELKVPDPSTINLVEDFPRKDGWYLVHPTTVIPQGNKVAWRDETRYLWRRHKGFFALLWYNGSCVGPVARGYSGSGINYARRGVNLEGPSMDLGVALF